MRRGALIQAGDFALGGGDAVMRTGDVGLHRAGELGDGREDALIFDKDLA
jgi:hypothetical protein